MYDKFITIGNMVFRQQLMSRCNRCEKTLNFAEGECYYFIEGDNYCVACGVIINEGRKAELEKEMYQELFFGDEM